MDADLPAIQVENLSTSYRVHTSGAPVLGGFSDMFRRGRASDRIIPALRDVSFTVPRGNVLGVIGRNGAGKSTLLRCLAGILAPEQGRVTMRGQISTLLTIGVGMSQHLTGRENIRLGGLAMGIDSDRLDEITDVVADFAQLGEYIDFPVETYSTGMRSRLGFAVMAHLDPEILLIDEALAGGDTRYQAETAHKMADLTGQGRTIVLVSHSLNSIRTMATHAIWMHHGRVVEEGDPEDVAASYMRYCRLAENDDTVTVDDTGGEGIDELTDLGAADTLPVMRRRARRLEQGAGRERRRRSTARRGSPPARTPGD